MPHVDPQSNQLILSLKDLGVGYHLNGMFVGAFSYVDDVTLLAPTNMALKVWKLTVMDILDDDTNYLIIISDI